jgi:hypothetical protein
MFHCFSPKGPEKALFAETVIDFRIGLEGLVRLVYTAQF